MQKLSIFSGIFLIFAVTIVRGEVRSKFSKQIPGYGLELRESFNLSLLDNSFGEELLRKVIFPSYITEFLEFIETAQVERSDLLDGVKSDGCKGHILEWLARAENLLNASSTDIWALYMVDSWGKYPEGLFSGHVNALGDFDECVDIAVTNLIKKDSSLNPYDTPKSLEGRYCNNFLIPYNDGRFKYFFDNKIKNGAHSTTEILGGGDSRKAVPPSELLHLISLAWGVKLFPSFASCFPSTCEQSDVEQVLMNIFWVATGKPVNGREKLQSWPGSEYCYVGKKPDLDAADISVISLLGLITVLCLTASILDIYLNRGVDKPPKRGLAYQSLLSFSLYTNIPKWLSTRTSADDLGCLHGIRFLSTAWVILAHTWFVIIYIPYWNLVDVKKVQERWSIMTIMNSTVSVDTFFVISGLLVAYNVMKMLQKTKGKLNIPMFYIHRYLRLTPVYAVLIGVMATLVPYTGRGPYWFIMDRWGQICVDNWWTNMLYVNNFVNTSWLGEAWYLANDMQFYIVSPIFLLPLYHWELLGIILLSLATLLSTLSPILLVHFLKTTPTTIGTKLGQEDVGKWFTDIYIKPYARIQTYFVGMWLGYILYKTKGKRLQIPLPIVFLFWGISTATCLAVIYGVQDWFDPEYEIPKVSGLMYAGFSRLGWSVSIAWVIFACVKGYGWIVNDFLSWKAFMPLGRLCYCVYLVSLHLQMILHVSMKQPIGYAEYTMTNFFFAHMVMAYIVGFFFTLMVETPFMQLEKILLEGGGGRGGGDRSAANALPGPAANMERNGIFYSSTTLVPPQNPNNSKQE